MGDRPSSVNNAIDAYSGRYEFFKQTLTLGTAGLAGLAALFTDPARVPSDITSKLIVCFAGLAIITMVAFSAAGIATYANLLTSLARQEGSISPSRMPPRLPVKFETGVIGHAKAVIIALYLAWASLIIFAGYQIFQPQQSKIDKAIVASRKFLAEVEKKPENAIELLQINEENDSYNLSYAVAPEARILHVKISQNSGLIVGFSKEN